MLILAKPAAAPGWSLVAHTVQGGNPSTPATTNPIDTTGATIIIVLVLGQNTPDAPPNAPTDSQGNSWLSAGSGANIEQGFGLYHAEHVSTSNAHTFTNTTNFGTILVAAFSGVVSPALDRTNSNSGARNVTQLSSNGLTPSQSNCLVVFALSSAAPVPYTVNDAAYFITDTISFAGGVRYGGGLAWAVRDTVLTNPLWLFAGPDPSLPIAGIASFTS